MKDRRMVIRKVTIILLVIVFLFLIKVFIFPTVEHFDIPSTIKVLPTQTLPPLIRPTANFPGIITGMVKNANGLLAIEDNICVQVEQKALWKSGDFWDDFATVPVVHIFINNSETLDYRRTLTGVLYVELNSKGETIGTHGFGIETCIRLSRASIKRENIMRFEAEYHGDVIFSDSWNFIFVQ